MYLTHNYSFSIKAAAPYPVAIHIEITPYLAFFLFISGKSVATYLAPVQPKKNILIYYLMDVQVL